MGLGSRLAGTPYDQLTYQQRLMSAGDRARALAESGGVMSAMADSRGGSGSPDDENRSIMGMMSGEANEGPGSEPDSDADDNRGGFTMGQSYAGANEYRQRMEDDKRQRMMANRPGLEQRERDRSDDYYRGTYGFTPSDVNGGGNGSGGVLGMLGGRYPVVGAPGIPKRGYGGYGHSGGLTFEERMQLQNAGFEGRRQLNAEQQGAIGDRLGQSIRSREGMFGAVSGNTAEQAKVQREQMLTQRDIAAAKIEQDRRELAALQKKLDTADIFKVQAALMQLRREKASKSAEAQARAGQGGWWSGGDNNKVGKTQMPGYTAGLQGELDVDDEAIKMLEAKEKQLLGGQPPAQ